MSNKAVFKEEAVFEEELKPPYTCKRCDYGPWFPRDERTMKNPRCPKCKALVKDVLRYIQEYGRPYKNVWKTKTSSSKKK